MVDASGPLQAYPPPTPARPKPPPGVVYAAAIVTWIAASGTAALTLFLTLGLLLVAVPVADAFAADYLVWYVVGSASVVVAFSAAANVLAFFMLRGHRRARWVLVVLSMGAAVCGVMLGYYVAPLAVTAAALAVIVLLLLPQARVWFRAQRRA